MLANERGGTAVPTHYDTAPSIVIAADRASGSDFVEAASATLGLRMLRSISLADAAVQLSSIVSLTVAVVHVTDASFDDMLQPLAARIDAMAAAGVCRGIIIVGRSMLDTVFACISHPDVQILCDPDEADLVSALALACMPRRIKLHDIAGDSATTRLVRLSEEAGRLARALASLAENPPPPARFEPVEFPPPAPLTSDRAAREATQVRNLIRARRARDQFFRADLFADPAWDMLLDLMAARLEHKRVSVSSLCIAAAVPATTALRWIKAMTEQGILERRADNNDGRRIFIGLSDRASAAMSAYLEWLKLNPAVIV